MPSLWSWLSQKKNDHKTRQRTRRGQPDQGRRQPGNLSRSTGAAIWGEPTWDRIYRNSLTTDPPGSQGVLRIPRVFGPGLTQETASATRERHHWIVMSSGSLPGANMLHISSKLSGNMKSPTHPLIYRPIYPSVYPPEDVAFEDYASSYPGMIPASSFCKTERGDYIASPLTEHQLYPLQQGYTAEFKGPQKQPHIPPDSPDIGQVQPRREYFRGHLPGHGQNNSPADHNKLHNLMHQQKASRNNSQISQMSRRTHNGMMNTQEVSGGSSAQAMRNTSPQQKLGSEFLKPSFNRENFQEKANKKFTTKEPTSIFCNIHDQKVYFGQMMYEMRRSGGRSDRIVSNYIPKALDHQDLSGLLCGGSIETLSCGGSIETLSPATPTHFRKCVLVERSTRQSQIPDKVMGYPFRDATQPRKSGVTQGSSSQDYMRNLSPGLANTPSADQDCTRARHFTPLSKENLNVNLLSVHNSTGPDHVTPDVGYTDLSSNNRSTAFCSETTTTQTKGSLKSLEDLQLLNRPGQVSGFGETRNVYNQPDNHTATQPHNHRDGAADNADTTPNYTHSLSETRPLYTHSLSKTRPLYTHSLSKTRPLYTHSLSKTRPLYTHSLSKTRPNYMDSLSKTRPNYIDSLPQTRPNYIDSLPQTRPNYIDSLPQTRPNYINSLPQTPPNYIDSLPQTRPNYMDSLPQTRPNYMDSLSRTVGKLHQRLSRHLGTATDASRDEFNDDEVNFALNQLDEATISESERDLVRELECIFQTEGEVLY